MDTWNREELYNEIWEQPLVKVAAKYGISAVMLGKVCRKLQIPLPGRGFWAKKKFGKPVQRIPLRKAGNLPVLHRFKQLPTDEVAKKLAPEPEPTDAEYRKIVEVESKVIVVDLAAKRHKLVTEAGKTLLHAQLITEEYCRQDLVLTF